MLLFLNVCKQTFHIPHVGISHNEKCILMRIFDVLLFACEDEDIGRFSNTLKSMLQRLNLAYNN